MKQDSHAAIAVVDDDYAVLEAIVDLFESAGLTARTFSSAKDFLDSGALDSIGCLVSDIYMPGMDGWKLRSIAAERRPGLPIILITAHEETDSDMRLLSRDGRQVLFSKPFDAQRLLSAIKTVLGMTKE